MTPAEKVFQAIKSASNYSKHETTLYLPPSDLPKLFEKIEADTKVKLFADTKLKYVLFPLSSLIHLTNII